MTHTPLTDVANKTFDYVIAGGGTAGLTLAARLSEDPTVAVAVIEAGCANLDDPNILIPGQFGKTFLDPKYDWKFFTTKQQHCDDLVSFWPRGKSLGGSSSMNFMNWSKPCRYDINAFEILGNEGWNWGGFVKYSKKSERVHERTKEQLAIFPETSDLENRGTDGPIQTSIPLVHSLDKTFLDTMKNMGVRAITNPYGGDIVGSCLYDSSVDPKTYTRSYAATGYYLPNKDRPNLMVLTEALVSRVIFADRDSASPNDDLTATGVEFIWRQQPGDKVEQYIVHARKEVILSAGTIKSPHILELSGVGSKEVLMPLDIDVKVDLPGVGQNVQEHLFIMAVSELVNTTDHQTLDMLNDPAVAAEHMALHASGQGMYRSGISAYSYMPLSLANPKEAPSLIAGVTQDAEKTKSAGLLNPGLAEQLDLQIQALQDDKVPEMEIIVYPGTLSKTLEVVPGKKYVSLSAILSRPFSRGTIHATTKDASQHPEIDPHYFEQDFDLEVMVQAFKFTRAMANVEPWKSTVVRECEPGPSCSTDDEIRKYIKKSVSPVWHAVGSCSMLPREKYGVVDSKLKVYGTKNLRVVDISIIPLQVSSHLQATAYFIGEKAADIIRGCV